ncbi:MAG: ferrous iron transport protein A [Bryobacteraceae bacterium]|nr:ferrous iron transport protein A [Bryobacteraceae bacterium]
MDTGTVLQLNGKSVPPQGRGEQDPAETLMELREGEHGILEALEVPEDIAQRLMELGFIPGSRIVAARSAPGGDPRVFRVDGSEIALRRETAAALRLRTLLTTQLPDVS